MNQNELLNLFDKICLTKTYSDIASSLNVAVGTVKRWNILRNVPKAYQFELMKIGGVEIKYSDFSWKDKDQFFTPVSTAKKCFTIFKDVFSKLEMKTTLENDYIFIEPGAGSGNFMSVLPKEKTIGLDVEPNGDNILEQDYLTWTPQDKYQKYIVFGNPPFGLRGQLALKFINHSAEFADFVCFILPQLFESDGKGVPRKRVSGLNLIHSERISSTFSYPDNSTINVNCVFQVWSKYHFNDKYKIQTNVNSDVLRVYSLSDGGTPSTTRNRKMFYNCDCYIPSTCFGKQNMRPYNNFDSLPGRKGYGIKFLQNKEKNIEKFKNIIWSDIAFLSTNSAVNIRRSQITNQFCGMG